MGILAAVHTHTHEHELGAPTLHQLAIHCACRRVPGCNFSATQHPSSMIVQLLGNLFDVRAHWFWLTSSSGYTDHTDRPIGVYTECSFQRVTPENNPSSCRVPYTQYYLHHGVGGALG